ncbi:tetratricopeptide (TPR) repeat protein [Aquimarina sp. EL_43]|uniref:tetratricopeptide repeat protein n=1 Tax=Aquimarina TaxID=290174 RepID=UPI00046FC75D|nr:MULTISPECIES: tetratricopeptide repeat protein [Aquimarina]MBG6132311.1 tetratricopeptide (TPR) repeat protein [Aquimarina sp. EL_35]MBG6152442.1 tetratricopeptide (TPR) repeat protein [Aquimarina sp. EL_32]MBG6170631.1 tetratricopeptide (TPR) repeat protein [Aquimarina sp. EL_43]
MRFNHEEEENNFSITRYESMLRSNDVKFFDSDEFESIIHHYLENGKIAKAKKAISLGLSQHPSSVNLKLLQVEVLVFENRLDKADNLLAQLHAIEPENEEIYIQKANILSKQNDHIKAIELLMMALSYTNDAADVYSLIGMEYLFMDDFENAKINFMKCLEADDQDYSALYNVIYCFDFLEQHEEAIEYLNMFLNKNPYCEVAWHQVGKQYFDLEEYEKALAAYDFAIISDEYFIGAYLEKGKVLEKLKRHNEAIENYRITLELDDPTSFALLRIGKCYEKLGVDDLAIQHYSKTVHEDPLLDKGWIAITDFYMRKRDYQKALYYTNKAINIDGENVLYWKRYAKINNRLAFFEEAERGYRKAIELGNYELETWLNRSDILRFIGESNAAIQNLHQAIEFYPDNAEIQYRLAGLYYELQDYQKGEYHIRKALDLDYEYHIVLEELFEKIFNLTLVRNIISEYQ